MRLGEVDQILDSAMARGIGNSGLTTRAIQQANIEQNSLQSLSGSISESAAKIENDNRINIKNIGTQYLKQLQQNEGSSNANGFNPRDLKRPLIVGRNPSSAGTPGESTVILPAGNGKYLIRSVGEEAIRANENYFDRINDNLPAFGTKFYGGDVQSLDEIKQQIYTALSGAQTYGLEGKAGGGYTGITKGVISLKDLLGS
jgi:hypothetical protein